MKTPNFKFAGGGGGGGQGRTPHMKWVGMLVVVSLRGVNVGFWSHLGGVLGKTPSYLAVKVSFRVAREKIYKYIFDMYFLSSLLGVKKTLGPRPDRSPLGALFKISDEHLHPFSYAESPPPREMETYIKIYFFVYL